MKPTPKAPATVQAGLFDSVDVHSLAAENEQLQQRIARLQKDNRSWERSYQRLRDEHDQIFQAKLSDPAHPLQTDYQRKCKEVDDLRAMLSQQVWRTIGAPHRSWGSLTKDDLTELLVAVHPDKWQNQPAEKLAHELAVRINKTREGVA